jgi:hypothetical protein
MIHRIIIALSLFLTSSVAKSEIVEVCYSDLNMCTFVETFAETTGLRIYVPVEVYSKFNRQEVNATANNINIAFETFDSVKLLKLKAAAKGTTTQPADVTLNDLAAFGPEERGVIKEFRDCFALVASCSVITLSTPATSIFGYLGAKAVCSWGGVQCAFALMSYQEWKNAKTEENRVQREKDDSASASSGGGSNIDSPGSWGGHESVVFEETQTCRQPPAWTGESCYWMPPYIITYDLTDHHWVPGECVCTGTQGS